MAACAGLIFKTVANDLEAAEAGHSQAQQRNIGAELVDQPECRVTVVGLAHDVQVGGRRRELPEMLP
jgi:hypothetical protein